MRMKRRMYPLQGLGRVCLLGRLGRAVRRRLLLLGRARLFRERRRAERALCLCLCLLRPRTSARLVSRGVLVGVSQEEVSLAPPLGPQRVTGRVEVRRYRTRLHHLSVSRGRVLGPRPSSELRLVQRGTPLALPLLLLHLSGQRKTRTPESHRMAFLLIRARHRAHRVCML